MKYGFLVWPHTQIVALRAHWAKPPPPRQGSFHGDGFAKKAKKQPVVELTQTQVQLAVEEGWRLVCVQAAVEGG